MKLYRCVRNWATFKTADVQVRCRGNVRKHGPDGNREWIYEGLPKGEICTDVEENPARFLVGVSADFGLLDFTDAFDYLGDGPLDCTGVANTELLGRCCAAVREWVIGPVAAKLDWDQALRFVAPQLRLLIDTAVRLGRVDRENIDRLPDQESALAVLNGLSEWARAQLPAPASNAPKDDDGKRNAKPEPPARAVPNAAAVLPNAIRDVIEDASRSVDDRLREISRTLPEFFARKSPSLAETFGCTPDNIRQTRWWKDDRKAWLESQKREGPSFDDL